MKFFALSALLGAQVAAAVTWTEVDDPRCHNTTQPVIPPSPEPTPYPTPPTPIEEYPGTTAATTAMTFDTGATGGGEVATTEAATTVAATTEAATTEAATTVAATTVAATTMGTTLPPIVCDGRLTHFDLIEANTGQAVPGFAGIKGYVTINLSHIKEYLPLSLEALGPALTGAKFQCDDCIWQDDHFHQEGAVPFAMNGDSNGGNKFGAVVDLETTGTYTIYGMGRDSTGWDDQDDGCKLVVTIKDGLDTIDNDDYCAPEQIKLSTVGNQIPESAPVQMDYNRTIVNETVFFVTNNTINGYTMDWITTSFVTGSGVEVCDKITNFGYHDISEHLYEAKCFNGYAYADVYAYSSAFSDAQASADTSMLPAACRNDFEGKVIKYSYVMSCDCGTNPDVPDTVTGNDPEPPTCNGWEGKLFGEPHVYPYDAVEYNCQGEGEFLVTKAKIAGRDYDFQMNGRFTRYRWMDDDNVDMPWTWNDGISIQQDVHVQISVAEVPNTMSMQFNDMWVNFYVEGVQRKFQDGSGDHRVQVSIQDRFITLFFFSTGIEVKVEVRAYDTTDALQNVMNRNEASGMQIPGCFTVTVCIPNDNDALVDFTGLWGTPNDDPSDDYKTNTGTVLTVPNPESKWYDRTQYCIDNWCVDKVDDSLFVPDASYGFSYYNKCDESSRRLLEDDSRLLSADCTLPEEAADLCDDACPAEDVAECERELCAGLNLGAGAQPSVFFCVDVEQIIEHVEAVVYMPAQDDFAGCSLDFKTTVKSNVAELAEAGFAECVNQYECDVCLNNSAAVWLGSGDLEYCFGLDQTVSAEDECCAGLKNEGGKCVEDGSRRLAVSGHVEVVRPDIPEVRNIVPLHTEL